MTQMEIAGLAATALTGTYAILMFINNMKLKHALQKQRQLSEMWQKSSESVFLMAQKGDSPERGNMDQRFQSSLKHSGI